MHAHDKGDESVAGDVAVHSDHETTFELKLLPVEAHVITISLVSYHSASFI